MAEIVKSVSYDTLLVIKDVLSHKVSGKAKGIGA